MNERFKKVLKIINKTQTEIALALEIEQGTVSGWTKDKNITKRNLSRLESIFGINSLYILTGEGSPVIGYQKSIIDNQSVAQEPQAIYKNSKLTEDEYINIIKSLNIQIKNLTDKINTLELEAEQLRQQKYNYRKPITNKQHENIHNKGAPTVSSKRFYPK